MSDLYGNHIVGFPTRRLICMEYLDKMANGVDPFNKQLFTKRWQTFKRLIESVFKMGGHRNTALKFIAA